MFGATSGIRSEITHLQCVVWSDFLLQPDLIGYVKGCNLSHKMRQFCVHKKSAQLKKLYVELNGEFRKKKFLKVKQVHENILNKNGTESSL